MRSPYRWGLLRDSDIALSGANVYMSDGLDKMEEDEDPDDPTRPPAEIAVSYTHLTLPTILLV